MKILELRFRLILWLLGLHRFILENLSFKTSNFAWEIFIFLFFSHAFFTFFFSLSFNSKYISFSQKINLLFPQNFFSIKFQIYASFIIIGMSGINQRTQSQSCNVSFYSFYVFCEICVFSYLNWYNIIVTFFLGMSRFAAFRSMSAAFLFLSIFRSRSWTTSSLGFI